MLFSETLKTLVARSDNEFEITIGEDWSQGRASYGGLIAAAGNEAMRRLVPRDRPLRSLQTTFVGPAPAGTLRMQARVLRIGKAVTLAQCEIFDGEQVAALLVGVYGGPRPSAAVVAARTPEAAPRKVEEINEVRYRPELGAPAFIQHFAVRWSQGAKPFSGQHSPTKAFIRHRDEAPLTEAHVISLVDCIPTPAMSLFKAPAPASSLVWTLEFIEHDFDFAPDLWWRIDTDIDAARDGYVQQSGVLIDPNGRPVALTRQLFVVFG